MCKLCHKICNAKNKRGKSAPLTNFPAQTKNYRAIAGSSLVLKLFDKVILIVWDHLLTSGSFQMVYKPGSSTAQCSYVMMETLTYFLKNGSNPMVALDMSSAFDK